MDVTRPTHLAKAAAQIFIFGLAHKNLLYHALSLFWDFLPRTGGEEPGCASLYLALSWKTFHEAVGTHIFMGSLWSGWDHTRVHLHPMDTSLGLLFQHLLGPSPGQHPTSHPHCCQRSQKSLVLSLVPSSILGAMDTVQSMELYCPLCAPWALVWAFNPHIAQ